MKQWIFSTALLLLANALTGGSPFTEYKKEIRKEYSIQAEGLVGVSNKYGKVQIHAWDKSVASFQVIITVNATNEKRADEIFETISVHFSHSPSEVRALTEIENKPKSVWSWWWNSSENSEFQIDYVVYIPTRAKVDIANKYGDIIIDELANKANIDLKYGNLRLVGSSDEVAFILGYSKAKVGNTAGLSGEAKYSTLKFNRTENMNCESKYSKVEVAEARDLRILSKYDTYVIGKARSIQNEGKYDDFEVREVGDLTTLTAYTDWEVHSLNGTAVVEMKYGEFKIFKVGSQCKSIDFKGNYAQLKLDMEPGSEFVLNMNSSYADLKVPDGFTITRDIRDGQSRTVSGFMRNPNAKMVLNADITYGGVSIR